MKKVMFFMAVAGMFAFAACNNNTPATEETLEPAAETEMVENECDTTVANAPVEDAAETPAE